MLRSHYQKQDNPAVLKSTFVPVGIVRSISDCFALYKRREESVIHLLIIGSLTSWILTLTLVLKYSPAKQYMNTSEFIMK